MTISLSYMVGYRMDLNASRMFVAVVQAGSLSAAATRLGIPLPTLSRRYPGPGTATQSATCWSARRVAQN